MEAEVMSGEIEALQGALAIASTLGHPQAVNSQVLNSSALHARVPRSEPRLQRISQLAHRGTTAEGSWEVTDIEGRLPADLRGTLLRNGPGSKSVGGRALSHFFDGDALVTSLRLEGSNRVFARSRFVATPERAKEQLLGRMLYHEFGTAADARWVHGYKKSPSISLLPLPDRLLAFSEADRPIALDPADLATRGTWNFGGTLRYGTSFTAHPKTDPVTGAIYAYGINIVGVRRVFSPLLRAFRMAPDGSRLTLIASVPLSGFSPIHDMMITDNYLVFVICPLTIGLVGLLTRRRSVADAMEYDSSKPLRIVVVRKDGSAPPIEMTSAPAATIFHHVNAYETDGGRRIVFHSMTHDNATVLDVMRAWAAPERPALPRQWVTRFELDLVRKRVVGRHTLSDGVPGDFPCIDARRVSSRVRFVHALESPPAADDPLDFNWLACWDLETRSVTRLEAGPGRTLGEPVFVPHPDGQEESEGWLLLLGYDSRRDETFLEVREAISLEFKARVWLGRHIPLGFHGTFIPAPRASSGRPSP
jgi:all-trans-8'-apo-beta-carotenal 15,15'-oxygenase